MSIILVFSTFNLHVLGDDGFGDGAGPESKVWTQYFLAADRFDKTIIRDWNHSMDVSSVVSISKLRGVMSGVIYTGAAHLRQYPVPVM